MRSNKLSQLLYFVSGIGKTSLKIHYENNTKVLTVRKPGVSMRDDWTIVLQ